MSSLQIGRVRLGEADLRPFEETTSNDARSVTLKGIIHSASALSVAEIVATHDDILGLPGNLVAGIFDTKSHRNAYYTVTDTKSSLIHLAGENIVRVEWEIELIREGSFSEVDLETRLAGPLSRANDHTLTGVRWTAPSGLHKAFWAGANSLSTVIREGDEGPVKVFLGIPAVLPSVRWTCEPTDYEQGQVRLTDDIGERAGTEVSLGTDDWELDNSLVALRFTGDQVFLRHYQGPDWLSQEMLFLVNSTALGAPSAVSIKHNQPERITVRLVWGVAGRVTADITLRRGSRFVQVLFKSGISATFSVRPATDIASTSLTGMVRSTANNGNGNRLVIGSAKNFTANTVTGAVTKSSSTRLDVMLAIEKGGSSAVAGDTAAEMLLQYLGSPAEAIVAVRR